MFDILSLLPGKKKKTHSGWVSFNAICCSHRGHRSDKRGRGGLKFDGQTNWVMHCFNCGYSCSFTLGRSINNKTRQLLRWCGVDNEEIQKWSLESLQHKDMLDFTVHKKKRDPIKLKTKDIPDGELLDESNPNHTKFIDYLTDRGINPYSYPFMVTPSMPGRYSERIIIPYTYGSKIVGHTSRFIDNRTPKYINDQQPGYVFNMDVQHPDWQVCIVVEGIFDALSIDGVAIMHDDISSEQAQVLANLNKKIIVVPDRDKTGLSIIDKALELGYSVSLPDWAPEIKDANDAVKRYGKLATILSILQNATMSKIKLELRKKQIEKQLR
jgi:hypothetical protein